MLSTKKEMMVTMNRKDSAGNELNEYGFRKDFDWDTRFDLKTEVGKYTISTVDLGLDHSFGFGPPLYYETMIFLTENFGRNFEEHKEHHFEGYQERYSTEEEAREGHKKAVEMVKKYIEEGEKDDIQ